MDMKILITITIIIDYDSDHKGQGFLIKKDEHGQKSPGRDKSLQPTFFLHSFDCNLVMGGEHFLKVLKVIFFKLLMPKLVNPF